MDDFVEAELQTFHSYFTSPSSPLPGNNLKVGNGDEYQDTVPFDDTPVLESLSIETQLVNLDVENEPLDNLESTDDIGKQVVLDSDDEGTDRPDVVSVVKRTTSAETQRSAGGTTLGYVGYLRKRSNTVGAQTLGAYCSANNSLSAKGSYCDSKSVHTVTQYQKPHVISKNGVSAAVEEHMNDKIVNTVDQAWASWECNDKGSGIMDQIKSSDLITKVSSDSGKFASLVACDHDVATLSCIESQEPEDLSEANAVDFVNHYLSVIDVNLPQENENKKMTRIKSPPACSAKGPQSLARRANLRTNFQASRSFNWDENQSDDGGGFILRKRNLSQECKEKLQGEITYSTCIESRYMVHNSNEIGETVQASAITKSDTNFVAGLDKQFDAASLGQQQENDGIGTDAAGIFDVGFDTQMAAEAMEELLYAPLPHSNATVIQNPESILKDSPKGTVKDKAFSFFNERPEPGFSGRRSNRTKRRSNKFSSSLETLTENQKLLNQREQSGNQKRKKADKNIGTSKSVKNNSLCKEKLTGTFSPIACRTRCNASVHSLKRVEGSWSNHDVVEVGVVRRKRNISSNSKVNQTERIEPVVSSTISNSDMWTYPKRKRTRPSNKMPEKVDIVNSILHSDVVENIKLDVLPDAKAKVTPVHKKASKLPLSKELTRLGFADRQPDFTSKNLRRRRTTANIRVLFSQSLDDDIMKQQKKISARLGLSVAFHCSDATHFITDRFVRTSNMLEAIAAGKPVVTHLWLESCAQASCLVDEKMYILRDEKKEKEIGFSMPVSLARAKESPLLKGQRVFTTPNVKPGKEIIESLVRAVHGQALDSIAKDKRLPDDLLILSCKEDYSICEPLIEKGAAVYSSELLLSGIVTHKLDYKRHELFTDHVSRKGNRFSNTYSRRSNVLPFTRN